MGFRWFLLEWIFFTEFQKLIRNIRKKALKPYNYRVFSVNTCKQFVNTLQTHRNIGKPRLKQCKHFFRKNLKMLIFILFNGALELIFR